MATTRKSRLLTALALLLGTTHIFADPLDGRRASVGVDYTISFSGSPRHKPEAPSFGFNVSMDRGPAANSAPFEPALRMRNQFDKLIDVRFDAANHSVRNMYVGGINVLVPIQRMGVDGATTTTTTQLSWPLVAAGFASFYLWAEDQIKPPKPLQKTCAVGFKGNEAGLNVTSCCDKFSGGTDTLNAACV